MHPRFNAPLRPLWAAVCTCAMLSALVSSALVASAAPRKKTPTRRKAARKPEPVRAPAASPTRPLSEAEARQTVALLDDAYGLLLEETHATYHTKPSMPVAASIIRQVQERMTKLGWPRARFLAVNAVVMHPNHVPRDAFDRRAVAALRRGAPRFEEVVDGQLRVGTVVPTGGPCFACHWAPQGQQSKAAITWTIPLSKGGEASK